MSYTPTTWVTGDTATATKMNKIEQGIANASGGGGMLITETNGVLNKTYNEITTAISNGILPFLLTVYESDGTNAIYPVYKYQGEEGFYGVVFLDPDENELWYVNESSDGALTYFTSTEYT